VPGPHSALRDSTAHLLRVKGPERGAGTLQKHAHCHKLRHAQRAAAVGVIPAQGENIAAFTTPPDFSPPWPVSENEGPQKAYSRLAEVQRGWQGGVSGATLGGGWQPKASQAPVGVAPWTQPSSHPLPKQPPFLPSSPPDPAHSPGRPAASTCRRNPHKLGSRFKERLEGRQIQSEAGMLQRLPHLLLAQAACVGSHGRSTTVSQLGHGIPASSFLCRHCDLKGWSGAVVLYYSGCQV
jgi:hypothetical protein